MELQKEVKEDDVRLIGRFLERYNKFTGNTFEIDHSPDYLEHEKRPSQTKKTVDVIAVDGQEKAKLAIEHTTTQPFVDERKIAQTLFKQLQPLENDLGLLSPGYVIQIGIPIKGFPKRNKVDLERLRIAIGNWLKTEKDLIREGLSDYEIPGLPYPLALMVDKYGVAPAFPGRIDFCVTDIPNNFDRVIRKALEDKLPKLAQAQADKRILLLERGGPNPARITYSKTIESLEAGFHQLTAIDEIWLADTTGWERQDEDTVSFSCVWPKDRLTLLQGR